MKGQKQILRLNQLVDIYFNKLKVYPNFIIYFQVMNIKNKRFTKKILPDYFYRP